MADQCLLRSAAGATPRSVTLTYDDEELVLTDARGLAEWVAIKRLRPISETGGTLVLRRRFASGWSLHLSGETARNVRSLLPPLEPRFTRMRRWAFRFPKLAGLLIVLPFFLVEHIPGPWLVPITTPTLAARIDRGALAKARSFQCSLAAGQRALEDLARRLSKPAAPLPTLVALNQPSFVVSAIPGPHILVFRAALAEVDAEVLAAMLAHELAHIEHGHVVRAVARAEGTNFLWRLIDGPNQPFLAQMRFTREEEQVADDAAIRTLRAARISLAPAAAFFARIDRANQESHYYAQDYSHIHPGGRDRAASWAKAAAAGPPVASFLDRDRADALFNLCAFAPNGAPIMM